MSSMRNLGARHSKHEFRGDSCLQIVFCIMYEQCDPSLSVLEGQFVSTTLNNKIILCSGPGHVRLQEKKAADFSSRCDNDREARIHKIPYEVYDNSLKRCIRAKCQFQWKNKTGNKPHPVTSFLRITGEFPR